MPELNDVSEAITAHAAATAASLATLTSEGTNTAAELRQLQQIVAGFRHGGGGDGGGGDPAGSLIGQIEKSEEFLALRAGKTRTASIPVSVASLLEKRNTIVSDLGGGGTVAQPTRAQGIASPPQPKVFLHTLLPPLTATGSSVEFIRETSFTNNAASQQGEGAAKAESDLVVALVEAKIPTIAHFVKASRQALSDSATLAAYLNQRLLDGLLLKLEAQIVSGNGLLATMLGMTAAGQFTAFVPGPAGEGPIDGIRRAVGQLNKSNHVANAVILNPDDFTNIELVKDTLGRYVIGNPSGASGPAIWSVPVVQSTAMALGSFAVADLGATNLWKREDASITIGFSNDDFTKNLVTILAEVRAVVTVSQPAGIIFGVLPEPA